MRAFNVFLIVFLGTMFVFLCLVMMTRPSDYHGGGVLVFYIIGLCWILAGVGMMFTYNEPEHETKPKHTQCGEWWSMDTGHD